MAECWKEWDWGSRQAGTAVAAPTSTTLRGALGCIGCAELARANSCRLACGCRADGSPSLRLASGLQAAGLSPNFGGVSGRESSCARDGGVKQARAAAGVAGWGEVGWMACARGGRQGGRQAGQALHHPLFVLATGHCPAGSPANRSAWWRSIRGSGNSSCQPSLQGAARAGSGMSSRTAAGGRSQLHAGTHAWHDRRHIQNHIPDCARPWRPHPLSQQGRPKRGCFSRGACAAAAESHACSSKPSRRLCTRRRRDGCSCPPAPPATALCTRSRSRTTGRGRGQFPPSPASGCSSHTAGAAPSGQGGFRLGRA